MSIVKKLMNIQNELKAPKGQYNAFGKYSYRNCEDILEAVKPLLFENGLILNISDEIVMIGDRFYIQAVAKVIDEENNYIEAKALARESLDKKGMDASQITGATSSYARKYALNGLFCIDDTKDSDYCNDKEENKKDSKNQQNKVTTKQQEQLVSDIQIAEIMKKCSEHKKDISSILNYYKISNLKELTVTNYIALIKRFKEV